MGKEGWREGPSTYRRWLAMKVFIDPTKQMHLFSHTRTVIYAYPGCQDALGANALIDNSAVYEHCSSPLLQVV